ncbi:isochorismatase family cysteine hydrolase [Streptomyces melanogenes]|uniref:isochorismatase family cysteine hydrolase n=1 Tax=Streptomyces melanogenes TaxID=67326 RepID=UPI00167E839A|nr:isochorismatase family cysteine hydrolase [Streptomyces melanogenes]
MGKADWVDPRSTALIVIDVQQGFINRHSRGVLPSIVRLVEGWRTAAGPVVFTRFHNEEGSPYETITGWTRLRTAEEQALVEELAPFTDVAMVIDKTQSSIFTPEATQLIRDRGWRDLVLCGIDTDACVYDTAIAAYQAGYRPWIVTDACASSGGPQYHDAALLLAARNIGAAQLVTIESILSPGPQGARA